MKRDSWCKPGKSSHKKEYKYVEKDSFQQELLQTNLFFFLIRELMMNIIFNIFYILAFFYTKMISYERQSNANFLTAGRYMLFIKFIKDKIFYFACEISL